MIEQPDLFSVNAPGLARHDHPATSREAAWRVTPRTGTQRRRVLDAIANRPSTDEELQQGLRMSGNTERPRRVELVAGGWICDSGLRRRTADGGEAIVWTLARQLPREEVA